MPRKLQLTKATAKPMRPIASGLLAKVRRLILAAREGAARTFNAGLTVLYWEIGTRIRVDLLRKKRADYGEGIVQSLSAQLAAEFGRGFSRRNLFNMVRFAEVFPDREIVQSLVAQLGWTHFLAKSGIRVSSYWTDVLPKAQLQKKLRDAVRHAQARLAAKAESGSTSQTTKRRRA